MSAEGLISAAIERDGPLTFSAYMDLALYHPEVGFYAAGGAGRRRDFITSPEVGPLFGAVMSRALDHWWDECGRPASFTVVEAGAGPGTLARSILRSQPRCAGALRYVAVETSETQRTKHPQEVESVSELPSRVGVGVVFANELLDNLPFDILQFEPGKGWFEVLVGFEHGCLREVLEPTALAPVDTAGMAHVFRMPVQRRAAHWLRTALASLDRGRVVAIDYAVPSYPVEQGRDWLRTYADHARGGSPLAEPGTHDITADVNIEGLGAVAVPAVQQTQADWLTRYGIEDLVAEGRAHWHEHAAAPSLEAFAMRSRIGESEALLDPSGLGSFVVMEWPVS